MKALTITRAQYSSDSLKWSYLYACDANIGVQGVQTR